MGHSLAWPRTSSLASLTLGKTFCLYDQDNNLLDFGNQNGHHWMVNPLWIKNSGQGNRTEPRLYPVPVMLNPYIRYYLHQVRPLIIGNPSIDHFWINQRGRPLSADSCREYIRNLVARSTGATKMTIQKLRININANYYRSGPHTHQNRLWWNYMMDHTEETANQYYDIWEMEDWAHQAATNPHPSLVSFKSIHISHLFTIDRSSRDKTCCFLCVSIMRGPSVWHLCYLLLLLLQR